MSEFREIIEQEIGQRQSLFECECDNEELYLIPKDFAHFSSRIYSQFMLRVKKDEIQLINPAGKEVQEPTSQVSEAYIEALRLDTWDWTCTNCTDTVDVESPLNRELMERSLWYLESLLEKLRIKEVIMRDQSPTLFIEYHLDEWIRDWNEAADYTDEPF